MDNVDFNDISPMYGLPYKILTWSESNKVFGDTPSNMSMIQNISMKKDESFGSLVEQNLPLEVPNHQPVIKEVLDNKIASEILKRAKITENIKKGDFKEEIINDVNPMKVEEEKVMEVKKVKNIKGKGSNPRRKKKRRRDVIFKTILRECRRFFQNKLSELTGFISSK